MENEGVTTIGELRHAIEGLDDEIEIAWGVVDRLEGGEDITYSGDVENSADPRRVLIILREREN